MKISKTSQILTALFSLACAIAAGYLILRGSGMFPEPSISLILLTAIFIILLSSSRKSFYFILLPLVCLHAIYTPTGLNFGAPSYQYIASVLATDMLETKEFLMQIPVSSYLAALAIPVLVFLHYKSAVKFGVKFYRNKTFIALATLLIGYNLPIAAPLKETIDSSVEIVNEWQKLKKMSQESSWGQSTLENSKYQDYVMILGESARKDYLHAYGYPVNDTPFMSSANGTLIDEEFCQEMLRVKNFVPAISLEGSEEANDGRRGEGVYAKVMHAMELLKAHKLPFGISTCYTSANVDSVSSEEYFDKIIDCGALFVWFFHYMPTGNDAVVELMPNPQQREKMYHQIRKFRQTKSIFSMDFHNDAEYVGGCIAGGRRYLHINANGDVDPCVFIHYSNSNIYDNTLLEALKSPIFMAYHDGQPFNENMLRPCPMLENPKLLRQMVEKSGAKSTDLQSPETAEHLCAKCDAYAEHWAPKAEELFHTK